MRLFREDAKIEALRRAPLFEDLSRKELEQLARHADDLEVEAGTTLTREGERGREFFVILEGEVDITRGGSQLGTMRPGDFIGEIALIEDIPRTATATAKTPVRFFVLSAQGFRSVVDEFPDVERRVLRALARRLAAMTDDPRVC